MASVGEKLRAEREARNLTLDDMAASTGIGRSYLEALERDEIRELPGKAFGKLYIRAYAEVLGFDPQPWIDDYDRERRSDPQDAVEPPRPQPARPSPARAAIEQWRESKIRERKEPETEPETTPEPAPVEVEAAAHVDASTEAPKATPPTPGARRFAFSGTALAALGLVAVAAALAFAFLGGRGEPPSPRQPAAPPPVATPAADAPRQASPVPIPQPAPTKQAAPETTGGPLTVPEFGVGRRIVESRLEGEADRFAPFDRVCFATHVLGGRSGDVVRHVWLYEGRIEQTISLRVGGPDWHTHSNKTLARAGSWAVEARDAKGNVLARANFTCAPAVP